MAFILYVNGNECVHEMIDPSQLLIDYLRNNCYLTGTKSGCNEGGCGACTVMVSYIDKVEDKICHKSVNACLVTVITLHGKAVTTVEGIGSSKKLHAVQKRLALAYGSQCGFCTPGFVMSMYSLLRNNALPPISEIDEALQGNLCRCTGYVPILEAFYSFSKEFNTCSPVKCDKSNCCKNSDKKGTATLERINELQMVAPFDSSQDLIFPPKLNNKIKLGMFNGFEMCRTKNQYHQPTTIIDALEIASKSEQFKYYYGENEMGIDVRFGKQLPATCIFIGNVTALTQVKWGKSGLIVGAAVTLANIQTFLQTRTKLKPDVTRPNTTDQLLNMINRFAGKHFRNSSAVAWSIIQASAISDINVFLLSHGATVTTMDINGNECVRMMDNDFFPSYRQTIIKSTEMVISVQIPWTTQDQLCGFYKQSMRFDDDLAVVNASFCAQITNNNIVESCRISYGGIGPTTKRMTTTESALTNFTINGASTKQIEECFIKELALPDDAPGGLVKYRRSLSTHLLTEFFGVLRNRKQIINDGGGRTVPNDVTADGITKSVLNCVQIIPETPNKNSDPAPYMGRAMIPETIFSHVSGETIYCEDVPFANLLHVVLVHSKVAKGQIKSIKLTCTDSKVGMLLAKDVPGSNIIQVAWGKEDFLAETQVIYMGQPVALVYADSHMTALKASQLVEVTYADIKSPITNINDAIKESSYFHITAPNLPLIAECGIPVSEAFDDQTLRPFSGEIYCGGQKHFYLETQRAVATNKNGNRISVISSTQSTMGAQAAVAQMLGVNRNYIEMSVTTLGGGFGGKETRHYLTACAASLVAYRCKRPAKCVLERNADMTAIGGRSPMKSVYKFGIDPKSFKFKAIDCCNYVDAGATLDLTIAVAIRALQHAHNGYQISSSNWKSVICKTDLPSNTAFRGFGGPQALFSMEQIVSDAAYALGVRPEMLREVNLVDDGDTTSWGFVLTDTRLKEAWNECKKLCDYEKVLVEVENFNKIHATRKRGICLHPIFFPVGFSEPFLEQGAAMVNINADGSVLVHHSGIEMGQGISIKIMQIAADALGINRDQIRFAELSSDVIPNASPTAASRHTDLCGFAIKAACKTLLARLDQYKKLDPNGNMKSWACAAYMDRTSLSAVGFYKAPTIPCVNKFDLVETANCCVSHFVYAAGFSMVEIDCLTGSHTVHQVTIVEDVGRSLNPTVDVGQVQGGFMQGYGYFVLEKVNIAKDGRTLSTGPQAYKIPTAREVPRDFRIAFLDHKTSNTELIHSSKAIGEPPLFAGAAVFFAIKDAIHQYRTACGKTGKIELNAPATADAISMASLVLKIEHCNGTDAFVILIIGSAYQYFVDDTLPN